MTVAELRKLLSNFPDDRPVGVTTPGSAGWDIKEVVLDGFDDYVIIRGGQRS